MSDFNSTTPTTKPNQWAYSADKSFDCENPTYELCHSKEEAIKSGTKMNLSSFWIAELIPVNRLDPSWPDIHELIDSACEDANVADQWVSGLRGLNTTALQAKIQPLLDQASQLITDALYAYNGGPVCGFGEPVLIEVTS